MHQRQAHTPTMRHIHVQVSKLHIRHSQLHTGVRSGKYVSEDSLAIVMPEFILCYQLDLNVLGLERFGDGDWLVGID
jgi:hypothetical protein